MEVKKHEIGPVTKKSKFSEAQIVYAIRENESGSKVAEITRRLGISQATFFTWKKKYGEMGVTELKRLRALEDDNAQLKKLVADLSLDEQMLQDIFKKSFNGCHTKGHGPLPARCLYRIAASWSVYRQCGAFNLVLQEKRSRRSITTNAHEGDSSSTGSLWF
jgi:putative transposase